MGANASAYKTDDGGNILHFAVECASHFKRTWEATRDASQCLRELLKKTRLLIDQPDDNGMLMKTIVLHKSSCCMLFLHAFCENIPSIHMYMYSCNASNLSHTCTCTYVVRNQSKSNLFQCFLKTLSSDEYRKILIVQSVLYYSIRYSCLLTFDNNNNNNLLFVYR